MRFSLHFPFVGLSEERSGADPIDEEHQFRPNDIAENPVRYTKTRLFFVSLALWWTVFLVALDQNIISPAIPQIASDFESWNEIGWYGSAYLLATCSVQLVYGSLYKTLPVRRVLMGAIVLFEAGSLLCALAPDSASFIVGRTIAGLGCAGIYSGALVTISIVVPPKNRPVFTSMIGTVFAIASIVGPLLGGAFTTGIGWRWCFYINLPIGAVTAAMFLSAYKGPDTRQISGITKREAVGMLHPGSLITLIPGLICLLSALQLAGTDFKWDDPRLIVLWAVGGFLMVVFVVIQFVRPHAMISHHIIRQKGVIAALFFAFTTSGAFFTITFYLPVWFQLVYGDNAVFSGLHIIPILGAMIVTALGAAGLTTWLGLCGIFLFVAPTFMSVGSGLLTTLNMHSMISYVIGLEVLFGIGFGFAVQQPLIIIQNLLSEKDMPVGLALTVFAQSLGGAIFVPVAANRFTSSLTSRLETMYPGLDASSMISGMGGGGQTQTILESSPFLRRIINDALMNAFLVAVPLSAMAFLAGFFVRYRFAHKMNNSALAMV